MNSKRRPPRLLFRIWVVRYEQWRPGAWDELPPRAIAVEAAEAAPLSAPEAARFIEGFNGTMLTRRCRLWAIAVPVTIRYEGDLRVGQTVYRSRVELLDCKNCGGQTSQQ
jgi:hypothetical protein